jgi:hypothetical protein
MTWSPVSAVVHSAFSTDAKRMGVRDIASHILSVARLPSSTCGLILVTSGRGGTEGNFIGLMSVEGKIPLWLLDAASTLVFNLEIVGRVSKR